MKVDYVYKDLSWCAFVIRSWHRIHQTCLFRFGSWWPWSAGRNDGFHHAWNWSLTSLLYGIHVTCSYLTYHCLLYTTTCVSSILRKYNPGLKDNKRKQTWWFTATVEDCCDALITACQIMQRASCVSWFYLVPFALLIVETIPVNVSLVAYLVMSLNDHDTAYHLYVANLPSAQQPEMINPHQKVIEWEWCIKAIGDVRS